METHRISESGPDRELLASLRALTGLDTPATIERFEAEYPNATVWATFGQSETSGLAMLSPYRDRPKSAGRPLFAPMPETSAVWTISSMSDSQIMVFCSSGAMLSFVEMKRVPINTRSAPAAMAPATD
jgi:hypothetical protein